LQRAIRRIKGDENLTPKNENLTVKGKLSKTGMERVNDATENGYDIYTIGTVLEVDIEIIEEFLNR